MKTWKDGEIRLTAWLSDTGLWPAERMSRALRGEEVEDIHWGPLSVELKTRKTVPKYLLGWVKQATRNSEGRVPIVVLHQDGTRQGHQVVMLELDDFVRLLKEVQNGHDSELCGS